MDVNLDTLHQPAKNACLVETIFRTADYARIKAIAQLATKTTIWKTNNVIFARSRSATVSTVSTKQTAHSASVDTT